MPKQYGVGVIGYGLSAKVFHIPFVLATPRFALRAIVQRHGDEAQRGHPGATVYQDAAALLADAAVDVVVVTTPGSSHAALAAQALRAGKHVIVEKPFVETAAAAAALAELAAAQQRLLSVFQNRRWDADFLTVQQLVGAGTLGRLVEYESHFDRFKAPGKAPRTAWAGDRAEFTTAAIYDLGSHLVDQAYALFGLPARVTGFLAAQAADAAAGANDAFTVLLHYDARGLLATLKASATSAETEQLRFWVRGDRAAFRKYHLDPQEDQARNRGLGPADPGFGVEDPSHAGTLTVFADGQLTAATAPTAAPALYTKFYELFADALDGTGPVPVSAADNRNVIRLIELAIQSSKEGRTLPVEA